MHDVTLSEIERLQARADAAAVSLQMDEEAFRAFYERTARPVWAYLSRITGDRHAADDLLQETYYRFLKSSAAYDSDLHRRNALFLIATNLVRDRLRRRRRQPIEELPLSDPDAHAAVDDAGHRAVERTEISRALGRMKPRERMLLWLAYAQGSSHREIAQALELKTASIKLLLFRARRKLAGLLHESNPRGGRS
jgi:RNA polymerase sigma-70 factor (ECF subfamily)